VLGGGGAARQARAGRARGSGSGAPRPRRSGARRSIPWRSACRRPRASRFLGRRTVRPIQWLAAGRAWYLKEEGGERADGSAPRPRPRWTSQRWPAWCAAAAAQREGEQAGEKTEAEADAWARARKKGASLKIETKVFPD